jgi:hypothetical protein
MINNNNNNNDSHINNNRRKRKKEQKKKRYIPRILQIVNGILIVLCGYELFQRRTLIPRRMYSMEQKVGCSSKNSRFDCVATVGSESNNNQTTKGMTKTSTPSFIESTSNQSNITHVVLPVGTVYSCGWTVPSKQIFPDYDHVVGPWDPKKVPYSNTTYRDILVIGMYGSSCPPITSNPFQTIQRFRGKVLWVRAEPKYWTLDSTTILNTKKNISTTKSNHNPKTEFNRARFKLYQMGAFEMDRFRDQSVPNASTVVESPPIKPTLSPSSTPSIAESKSTYTSASQSTTMASIPTTSTVPPTWQANTLQVHYLTFFVLDHVYGTERWEWFVDPNQRRRNTGQHSAIAYFTTNCIPYRQEAAAILSYILPIHTVQNGCVVDGIPSDPINRIFTNANTKNNSTNYTSHVHVVSGTPRSDYTQNYNLFHEYKYCLVMENTAMDGYITEKIMNAFLGGCLPIYYGTEQIYDIFHVDSFIYYDTINPQPALDLIQQLEADPNEYVRRLTKVPILKDGRKTVDRYFSLFPQIGDGSLNEKIRVMMDLPPISRRV